MSTLHFPAEFPTDCIRGVIDGVRDGDLIGVETVDHALHAVGCLNAFRGDGGIIPFGSVGDDCPSAEQLRNESCEELCDRIEAALPADEETRVAGFTIPPFVLPILAALVQKLIERLLREQAG